MLDGIERNGHRKHSAWATPAFIEVRAGEYSKNRDGRG